MSDTLARFRKSKPKFDTAAEAKAYYQGRLRELAKRAGMTIPALLEYAEHAHHDSYVTRQARNFRALIGAFSQPSKPKRDEVWALRVKYKSDGNLAAYTSLVLYRDPQDADQAGKDALEDETGTEYSVDLMDVK